MPANAADPASARRLLEPQDGMAYGRCIGRSPLVTGIGMVLVGALVVAFTIAFGG